MSAGARRPTLRQRLDYLEPLLAGVPASLELTADAGDVVAMLVPAFDTAVVAVRAPTLVRALELLVDELERLTRDDAI